MSSRDLRAGYRLMISGGLAELETEQLRALADAAFDVLQQRQPRDARKDPKPGDVWRKGKRVRTFTQEIRSARGWNTVVYRTPSASLVYVMLDEWEAWIANAFLIKSAPGYKPAELERELDSP